MRGWVALAVFAILSGCFASPQESAGSLAGVPPVTVPDPTAAQPSANRAHTLVDLFAMGHPFRNNDNMEAKRNAQLYLEGQLREAGLRVERHEYRSTGTNVLGFLDGTAKRDEWVVLTCHYDIIRSTVYGARDDGLGCAALLEMGRAFAETQWNRTLVFAFFDEEELGLLGSRAFVKDYARTEESEVVANLNFDPAGLHYPCGDAAGKFPVYLMITESKVEGEKRVPGYAEVLDAVREGYLAGGVPSSAIRVGTQHAYLRVNGQPYSPPGSDDDSFDAADIPSMWVGAPPTDDVGPVTAWGYPNHVPADTLQMIEARCGSRELLIEGLGVAMGATLSALVSLDKLSWTH